MASEISVASASASATPPPVSPVKLEAVPTKSAEPAPKQEPIQVVDTEVAVSEAIKPRDEIRIDTQSVMSEQDLTTAIQSLNDMMTALDRNINFSVDPGTGKDIVKVTDSNTGKTIRQIPAQETLSFIQNLDKMVGLLFDQKT
jgi:flagellar protein FlaG